MIEIDPRRLRANYIEWMDDRKLNVNITLQFNAQVTEAVMQHKAVVFVRRLEKKCYGRAIDKIRKEEQFIGVFFPEKVGHSPHLHGQVRVPEEFCNADALPAFINRAENIFQKLWPAGTVHIGTTTLQKWRNYITKESESEKLEFFSRPVFIN